MSRRCSAAVAAAVVLAVSSVAACSSSQPSEAAPTEAGTTAAAATTEAAEAVEGGTLVVAVTADPEMLDPSTIQFLGPVGLLRTMCEGLYRIDQDGAVQPVLATGTEVSDDGLTATVTLRDGVVFNDGTPFDSAAVQRSLERNAVSPYLASAGITSIDTPDDLTVVLNLAAPNAPLLASLAGPGGLIASPTALDELGEDFGQSPVCVGPFAFESWVVGEKLTVTKSELYYDADTVLLDGIEFAIISDPAARLNAVRTGEAHLALSPDDAAVSSLPDDLTLLTTPTYSWIGLVVNVENADGVDAPPRQHDTALASDALVRQAFSAALDREALVTVGSMGQDIANCSVISPAAVVHDDPDCPGRDLDLAASLLAEAGVEAPIPVTIMTSANNPSFAKISQAIQSMTAEAGFEVTIDTCEGLVCLERTRAGDFDTALVTLSAGVDPDTIATGSLGTGGAFATHGLSDPEIDDLLTRARQSYDNAERTELYQQAMDKARQNANMLILATGHFSMLASDAVQGASVSPDYSLNLADVSFTAR